MRPSPMVQHLLFSLCLLLLGLPPLSSPVAATTIDAALVKTDAGLVRGVIHDGVREFKGMPFARPPVGDLRWELPQPVAPWEGVLEATEYGPGCPQLSPNGMMEAGDEDCLFLNVTTPAQPSTTPRPVIVWVHGGSFIEGSSSLYPLATLALAGDAVVVSMNYRLGVFGFMTHPAFDAEHNGGYGLDDQRAALRWAQRNIAAFSGDPHNVTIVGESAGAEGVCMHLIAPEETRGLFHKAIIQSAGCVAHLHSVPESEAIGLKAAALVGCDDPGSALACLRQTPAKALLDAALDASGGELLAFAPSVGSKTVPRQGAEALRTGDFVQVPLINGGNAREMLVFVAYDIQNGDRVTAENYLAHLQRAYGDKASQVAENYPLSSYPSPPEALGAALSDFNPGVGINTCIYLQTAREASRYVPVYQYEFADNAAPPVTADPGFPLGAVHAAELPYLFARFSDTAAVDGPALAPASQRLADQMVAYWTSFARDGAPSAPASPTWTPFASAASVMRFAPGQVGLFDAAAEHRCAFWQALYPEFLDR